MRYAQVSTTMNVYGNAQMDSKGEAHGKVLRMVFVEGSSMNSAQLATSRFHVPLSRGFYGLVYTKQKGAEFNGS